MNRVCCALLLAAMAMIVGCGDLPPVDESAGGPAPQAAPAPAPPGDPNAATAEEEATAGSESGAAEAAADTTAAAPEGTVAGVGVGKKGQNYGGPGIVTTPIETYFRAEERIAFEAQIPKAMQLYKAEHNNKGPKTHEEYMNIIIKENGVKLPELPPGEEYLYDPETEQLMVKKAAQ